MMPSVYGEDWDEILAAFKRLGALWFWMVTAMPFLAGLVAGALIASIANWKYEHVFKIIKKDYAATKARMEKERYGREIKR